jgi:hypothetical protein
MLDNLTLLQNGEKKVVNILLYYCIMNAWKRKQVYKPTPPLPPPGNLIYPQVVKCTKCKKKNSVEVSPEIKNISNCYFCGNPYYIIKMY